MGCRAGVITIIVAIGIPAVLAAAEEPATAPTEPTQLQQMIQSRQTQRWSAAQIQRRIARLDSITSSQRTAEEVMSIMGAIATVPDARTRMVLFDQLGAFIGPPDAHTQTEQDPTE
jgi:hypothetical protein